jgi:hypothetical protein
MLAVAVLSFGVDMLIKDICTIGETRNDTVKFLITVHKG